MKTIKQTCYRGTRILLGNEKRSLINKMIEILINEGFEEIAIPIIQYEEIFNGKVGGENLNMMFKLEDQANRKLVLAPEYTAVVQQLSKETFKYQKDIKLFYIQECFRGERPSLGRYRQFTQFGIEILNPKIIDLDYVINLSESLIKLVTQNYIVNQDVTRGLDYYVDQKGFEIVCEKLETAKQICGGGSYEGGIGCALGLDRILLINDYE